MDEIEKIDEYERLPLKLAYQFLTEKGFESEANEIKESKDSYKSYTTTLRRGKIIDLLEKKLLLEEFINTYWANGKTIEGKRRIERCKSVLNSFRNSYVSEDEEEEERAEETSFAYEEHLKDYLVDNLSKIEPHLKLYKDQGGREGIEYPVDDDNKRIDILAIDKDSFPVIIELKVSRGYEKVIGQCLYYQAMVKKLLNSKRVRIIIIAKEITPRLKLATETLPDVELFEYKLSVNLNKVIREDFKRTL